MPSCGKKGACHHHKCDALCNEAQGSQGQVADKSGHLTLARRLLRAQGWMPCDWLHSLRRGCRELCGSTLGRDGRPESSSRGCVLNLQSVSFSELSETTEHFSSETLYSFLFPRLWCPEIAEEISLPCHVPGSCLEKSCSFPRTLLCLSGLSGRRRSDVTCDPSHVTCAILLTQPSVPPKCALSFAALLWSLLRVAFCWWCWCW